MSFTVQDLQPGDFTVTPVTDGFMVGQMIRRLDSGPWWTFIKIVSSEEDAVRLAVTRAIENHTRVWRQEEPNTFRLVVITNQTANHKRPLTPASTS